MSTLRIRWRDPALWPGVLDHLPPGHTAATARDRAEDLGTDTFHHLPPGKREQYHRLWQAALDAGFQESGLLLVNLTSLASALGHTSPIAARRFGQFCTRSGLWLYVPGKLYPHPRNGAPGHRARAHLVLDRA